MEPRIQYAQTKDGVSIAFWTMGKGMPLVQMPAPPWSHVQLECQLPLIRSMYECLAEKRMLIRYDNRGCGLSDREVSDYSFDAQMLDVEAVVDSVGLDRFALLGNVSSGPLAIAYAAHHPERVSHLLLWCSWARTADYYDSARGRAFRAVRESDFELYTESVAHAILGWSEVRDAHQFAAFMRECCTPDTAQALLDALDFDASGLLPHVTSPTLVLHRRQAAYPDASVARVLTSRIPGARLVLLEGTSIVGAVGDIDALFRAIDEFLAEGEESEGKAEPPEAGAFRTVLFTDVEGSTALTQRLGDAKARDLLRQHERMVREALKAHGGSELKTTGDGFMASFSSATRALESAIAMQRAFAAHNESAEEPILVRVGMNAGEPIAEDDPDGRSDLFGTAVIRAARIAAEAKGGEILVSNVVRELAEGKQFLFTDRGDVTLKGFDEPVRLYEVRWREEGS
jgi:class 3 adenylate cyclase